jgi:hypothetical protein
MKKPEKLKLSKTTVKNLKALAVRAGLKTGAAAAGTNCTPSADTCNAACHGNSSVQ